MAALYVTIRDAVHDKIKAKQDAAGFVNNDFALEQTYLPREQLKDIDTDGKLWVLGLSHNQTILTRNKYREVDVPVGIVYQKIVNPSDTTNIDTLMQLVEEIATECWKVSVASFAPNKLEFRRDENGTPYSFTGLREANVFEAIFTIQFKGSIV